MTTPIREQIITALDTRLKTITIGNGYSTNLGRNVFPWHVTELQLADLPAVSYRDMGADQEPGAIGQFRWALNIELSVVVSGSISPAAMRTLIQDIYTAIGTDARWSGLAVLTEQPSDEMTVEQQDRLITGATIKFRILYDAALWRT